MASYICGNCKSPVGTHLLRTSAQHPLGAAACPSCGKSVALERVPLVAFLPLLAAFFLFMILEAILEPTGVWWWLWLGLKAATLGATVYLAFVRRRLVVARG